MYFRDIPVDEKLKDRLRQSVQKGRLPHAQLFLGGQGSGNLALALAYARYVSCTGRTEEDACGQCPSCTKYNKLVHPDLHFVFPVVKSGSSLPVSDTYIEPWREALLANPYMSLPMWFERIGTEKSQGMIYTQESGEIIRKLNLKAFESDYKIMIIWMPEKMHLSCANKLLKMIEEPPQKTLFLLVAEDSGQIIQTIVSRTQLVKVPRMSEQAIMGYLTEKHQVAEEKAKALAYMAEGNLLKAIEASREDVGTRGHFEAFVELMRLAYSKNLKGVSDWAEEQAGKPKEQLKGFFEYSLRELRNNYVRNLQPEIVRQSEKEEQFSAKFSPYINHNNINKLTKEFNEAYYHIERNGYARLIFFDLGLKVIMAFRS